MGATGESSVQKSKLTGDGAMFWERKKNRMSFKEGGVEMAVSALLHHMDITRIIVLPYTGE